MNFDELRERVWLGLRGYTAKTALQLENTDHCTLYINPIDWHGVVISLPISVDDITKLFDIPVKRSSDIPIGQPKLVVHWELQV